MEGNEVNTNLGAASPEEGREVFGNIKLFPLEVEPLNEELWKDLKPQDYDDEKGSWQPADDMMQINYGVENFLTHSLNDAEDSNTPIGKVLEKLKNGEGLSEKEQRRVERTDNMIQEINAAIVRAKALQETYEKSLALEQEQISSLEEKEQNQIITETERSKLESLRKHVQEGNAFVQQQKELIATKEAAILNSKWVKR